MEERIKKFFRNGGKGYKIFISVIVIYLFSVFIFKVKTASKLKENGVFKVAKILEIDPGSYSSRYIKYEYLDKGKIQYGYFSFHVWEEPPVIGKNYLSIHLKDKNYLNFLFLDIELPDTFSLHSNPKDYIPSDPKIRFWKI